MKDDPNFHTASFTVGQEKAMALAPSQGLAFHLGSFCNLFILLFVGIVSSRHLIPGDGPPSYKPEFIPCSY
jgi:hypothetical protein